MSVALLLRPAEQRLQQIACASGVTVAGPLANVCLRVTVESICDYHRGFKESQSHLASLQWTFSFLTAMAAQAVCQQFLEVTEVTAV